MRLAFPLVGLGAAGLLGCSTASDTSTSPAPVPPAGELTVFDPGFIDASVDPCQDLYRYACGGWLKANPAPPDQPLYGRSREIATRNREQLRQLLEDAAAHPSGDNRTIADFYGACTDEAAVDAKGLGPLQPELDRIAKLKDKKQLPTLLAHLHEIGVDALFGFGQESDFKDAAHSIADIDQGGLGLPDRTARSPWVRTRPTMAACISPMPPTRRAPPANRRRRRAASRRTSASSWPMLSTGAPTGRTRRHACWRSTTRIRPPSSGSMAWLRTWRSSARPSAARPARRWCERKPVGSGSGSEAPSAWIAGDVLFPFIPPQAHRR